MCLHPHLLLFREGEGKLLLSSLLPSQFWKLLLLWHIFYSSVPEPLQQSSRRQEPGEDPRSAPGPGEPALPRLHCRGPWLPFQQHLTTEVLQISCKAAACASTLQPGHALAAGPWFQTRYLDPVRTPGARKFPAYPPSSTWNPYRRGSFAHPDHVAFVHSYTRWESVPEHKDTGKQTAKTAEQRGKER